MIFLEELQQLLNKHSKENESNTPDYALAMYINDCLKAYNSAIKAREEFNKSINKLVTQKPEPKYHKFGDETIKIT